MQGRDIIQSVAGLLGRMAAADSNRGVVGVIGDTGVRAQGHRKHESVMRFSFTTPDDIPVQIDFDMAAISKEYIDNMMRGLGEQLAAERRQRALRVPRDLALAVRGAY